MNHEPGHPGASEPGDANASLDQTLVFRQSSLACIILRTDAPRWTIVDANDAYLSVTHRTRDALVGRGLLEAFPESEETTNEEGAHHVRWSLEQTLELHDVVTLPVQRYDLQTPAGFEEHYWEMSTRPLVGPSGSTVALLHEVKNVTLAMRADAARARLQVELEEQNDALQEQSLELELINQQLQDTAVELEVRTSDLLASSTEVEEARRTADHERLRLRRIFDKSPVVIAIYRGPRHLLDYYNPTWEARIGRPGMLDKPFQDVFPEFEALGLYDVIDRVYATGEPFRNPEVHIPWKGAAGSVRQVDTYWDLTWQRLPVDKDGEFEILAHAVEVTEQVQAREAQAFLAEASLVLASSADYAETLANLAAAAVPRLGDWCAVDILDNPDSQDWPPTVTRVAMFHRDPDMVRLAETLRREYPENWNDPHGLPAVLRNGTPLYLADLPDALLATGARDARHLELLRAFRFRAVIIVPLIARERVVGALTLCMTDSERRYGERDFSLALDLGRRAGAAVDTTRLLRDAQHARARMEAVADRSIRLQRVTAAFANALTATEVAQIAIAEGVPAFDAADGVVYFRSASGESLELAAHVGLPEETVQSYGTMPLEAPLPLPDAMRSGRVVVLENREQVLARYPHLRDANERASSGAWLAMPLVSRGTAIAGIVIGFRGPRHFSDEDRAFGETLARLSAQALERARLYDEAQEAKRIAETANEAKSQFLATMSHELRTPLNAFGGYLELILMELRGPVTDQQRVDLERMQRSNRHLSKLIDDLLNFAKIEVGHVSYQIADVRVCDLLLDMEELMRPQCAARRVAWRVRETPAEVTVRADVERLRQILMNLVGNAAKFTPQGGEVSVWCDQTATQTRIHVSDTGPGIPAELLDQIFAPFVQVGRRLNAPGEGVGLGLAISREFAVGMGGTLDVVSEVGRGSTFTVTLPIGG